jgi:hypothetical protein
MTDIDIDALHAADAELTEKKNSKTLYGSDLTVIAKV